MFRVTKWLWGMMIPPVISLVALMLNSGWLFALFIISHFVVLKLTPSCRYYENVWMFVAVAISTIGVNIMLTNIMMEYIFFTDSYLVMSALRFYICYIVILSVEEVVMGVITRSIWRDQNDIDI